MRSTISTNRIALFGAIILAPMQTETKWKLSHSGSPDHRERHHQETAWVIPVMQTIHIISVAMVIFISRDDQFSRLGIPVPRPSSRRRIASCRGFSRCRGARLDRGVLAISEPRRSLPAEFQMKMLYLAVAIAFTICVRPSVRQRSCLGDRRRNGRTASAGTLVNGLALVALWPGRWSWSMGDGLPTRSCTE
jgi:hypothetical protein